MMPRRVATVDVDTWLFPEHTLLALARWLAQDKLDVVALQQLVEEAVAGRDIDMQATTTEIQYRNGILDDWHTVIAVDDLRGPQGIQGPPGDAGTPGTPTQQYEQSSPSDTWTIPHTFAYPPNVVIIDTAGTVLEGEVTYPDSQTVMVLFNSPTSGTAYLS
jgi:hypothetical protein